MGVRSWGVEPILGHLKKQGTVLPWGLQGEAGSPARPTGVPIEVGGQELREGTQVTVAPAQPSPVVHYLAVGAEPLQGSSDRGVACGGDSILSLEVTTQ